jgi:hypothetical protein
MADLASDPGRGPKASHALTFTLDHPVGAGQHLRGIDWQLWVERNGRMTSAKCPLRLEIESRLRSCLLRVSGMPLHTLTYTQLRLITEGKIAAARRLHVRGHDTLMHRPETPTIPRAST